MAAAAAAEEQAAIQVKHNEAERRMGLMVAGLKWMGMLMRLIRMMRMMGFRVSLRVAPANLGAVCAVCAVCACPQTAVETVLQGQSPSTALQGLSETR
jgi:hypothetical protein